MTEVQVYEGDGPTTEATVEAIAKLIQALHPSLFPEDMTKDLKYHVSLTLQDIIDSRSNQISEEEYEADSDNTRGFERVFGPEPTLEDVKKKLTEVTKEITKLDRENVVMGEKLDRIEGELKQ